MFHCPRCNSLIEETESQVYLCKNCGFKIERDIMPSTTASRKPISLNKEQLSNNIKSSNKITQKRIIGVPDVNTNYSVHAYHNKWFLALAVISALTIAVGFVSILVNASVAVILMMLGIGGVVTYSVCGSSWVSDREELRLQMLMEQIQNDIKNRDYISAKIKAEAMRFNYIDSENETKQWETTRKNLLKYIEELEGNQYDS